MPPLRGAATACALILALATTGGCDAWMGGGARITASEYDDIVAAMGALMTDGGRGQARAFAGALALARGAVPRGLVAAGDGAHGEVRGVEYNLSAVCSDAAGRAADCGEDATLAHVAVSWSGAWGVPRVDGEHDLFEADWTLDALASSEVLLAGHGEGGVVVAVSRAGADAPIGLTRAWQLDYRATYHHLVVDAETYEVSAGRVTYELEAERLSTGRFADLRRRFDVRCELTIDADGAVTLLLDGERRYRALGDGSVEPL
jgi:hypothetical protein